MGCPQARVWCLAEGIKEQKPGAGAGAAYRWLWQVRGRLVQFRVFFMRLTKISKYQLWGTEPFFLQALVGFVERSSPAIQNEQLEKGLLTDPLNFKSYLLLSWQGQTK